MPSLHKRQSALAQPHADDLTARLYDDHLARFAAGDHGQVDLGDDEPREIVREQLQAAAQRRGLQLSFRRGRGPLRFRVEAIPTVLASPPITSAKRPKPATADTAPLAASTTLAPGASTVQPPTPVAPATLPEPAAETQPPLPLPPIRPRQQRPLRADTQPPKRAHTPRENSPRREAAPRRQNDDRRTSNSRYDDVLPRWMREGERATSQPNRRRNDSKRRTRS